MVNIIDSEIYSQNFIRKVDKSSIPICSILCVNVAAVNMNWFKEYLKANVKSF